MINEQQYITRYLVLTIMCKLMLCSDWTDIFDGLTCDCFWVFAISEIQWWVLTRI